MENMGKLRDECFIVRSLMFTHNQRFCKIQYSIQAKIQWNLFKLPLNPGTRYPIPGTCAIKSVRILQNICIDIRYSFSHWSQT